MVKIKKEDLADVAIPAEEASGEVVQVDIIDEIAIPKQEIKEE